MKNKIKYNTTETLRRGLKSYNEALERVANDDETIEVPVELSARLSAAIDAWEINEKRHPAQEKKVRRFGLSRIVGAVASVAILIAAGTVVLLNGSREPKDTFTDPVEAYEATQKALNLFANTMDRGMKGIDIADETHDKAINMALSSLNKM